MINNVLKAVIYFIVLVLVQVLILNNIHFFRVAVPFLYLYFILKLPAGMSRTSLLLLSFLMGITIDAFSNTPGLHAAAATFAGFVRQPVIRLFMGKDVIPDLSPSYRMFGVGGFMKYTLVMVFLHHTVLYLVESFSLFDPVFLVIRILASVILTTLLICTVEAFNVESLKSGDKQ
ncbi:MAG: rod shape-determining protein MreD [Tannerellaceae bacterium]|nr:rod shape-determining protein MreD [Tannerellaceae bacterium]